MKEQPKLTPWFPAGVKPARRGVYNTSYIDRHCKWTGYSYWDGSEWTNQCWSPDRALVSGTNGANQKKRWRGLAAPAT